MLCRWSPVVFTEAVTATGSRLPRVRASELLGRGWLNTGDRDLSLADLRISLPARLAGELVDDGAHPTRRPVTDLAPGELRLEVLFTPASGQKVDERYGPATWLQVSASPPELLVTGAGDGTDLDRALTLAADVPEGVLHVTAHAASCDADPAIAFPACHLNQQDWGVPVRVAADGARTLRLPLLG